MTQILNILFLLPLSIWTGAILFFSFFTAPTLFRELPREMAGEVVSKIFPQYYMLGYLSLGIALISLLAKGFFLKSFPILKLILIVGMLGCTLYAGISVHPKAHLLKTVIRTMEDNPEKEKKQREFKSLHQQSVYLNLISLLAGIILIGLTAVRIQ